MFYCLVVGSRDFTDYSLMKEKLDRILSAQENVTIVSGGAKGADTLAEKYARERNYSLKVFPAQWDRYGKSAGFIRNRQMHEYISGFDERGCVAFWDGQSKGTKQNFSLCAEYDTPIRVVLFGQTK